MRSSTPETLAPQPYRRTVVRAVLGLVLATPLTASRARYDAAVGPGAKDVGARVFATLQQAIDAAHALPASKPYRIWLGEGSFQGQVRIDRPRIEIHGRGGRATILQFDAAAGHIAPDGKPWGTFRTWCVSVNAPDVTLRGLTIVNSFDAPAEMRRPGGMRSDEGGSQQALALSLGQGADRTTVIDCHLVSHQDTLYVARGRALFLNCRILGSYDFIFGGAAARFERCEIRSLPRLDPVEGYIAAPNTVIDQPVGLVFDHCRLTAAPGVPDASVFLARPWGVSTMIDGKRVRTVGMATYLHCAMGRHIAPRGWTNMWFTDAAGQRAFFEPEDARFAEFGSTGVGSPRPDTRRRGAILTAAEAARFSRAAMFGDWRPPV